MIWFTYPLLVRCTFTLIQRVSWLAYSTLAGELQYSAYSVNTVIYQMTEDVSGNLTEVGRSIFTDDCGGFGNEIKNQAFIVGTENTPIDKHQGSVVIGGAAVIPKRLFLLRP